MKKYWYIVKNSFKETNKSKIVFSVTLFQPLILLYGYTLFYSFLIQPGQIGTQSQILSYYIFILVVSSIDLTRFASDLQKQMHSEQYLNIDRLPINPFLYYFFVSVGRTVLTFCILLTISISYFIYINFDPVAIILFTPATIIAFFLAHLIFFMLTTMVFYQETVNPWLFGITTDFLSGRLIPLQLLPKTVQTILLILPFPYAFGALARNYSTFNLQSLLLNLIIAILWSAALFILATKLWHHGSYRFQEND